MKVVVFGAAGWVGRAILASLEGRHEVRACDKGPESWARGGPWENGEIVHGDIADYEVVDRALEGVDAIIHAAVYAGAYDSDDLAPFEINLKGLWNVLEAARHRQIGQIVHIGSCQVEHPANRFFSADVRRPDGSLYAVTKRLQEEMCRQFHEAFNQSIAVLRPCSIVDSRHDLAEACRRAIEKEDLGFEVLHMAGSPEADQYCNTQRAREVLQMEFKTCID